MRLRGTWHFSGLLAEFNKSEFWKLKFYKNLRNYFIWEDYKSKYVITFFSKRNTLPLKSSEHLKQRAWTGSTSPSAKLATVSCSETLPNCFLRWPYSAFSCVWRYLFLCILAASSIANLVGEEMAFHYECHLHFPDYEADCISFPVLFLSFVLLILWIFSLHNLLIIPVLKGCSIRSP